MGAEPQPRALRFFHNSPEQLPHRSPDDNQIMLNVIN
jgi:hypothetical protein